MKRRKRLILFYQSFSTFVKEDFKILRKEFEVSTFQFNSSKNLLYFLLSIIRQLIFSFQKVPFNDVVYIWFADYHSLIPALLGKIFRKKVIIVVGGYDAVAIPDIDFGVFRRNDFRSRCAMWTYILSDLILPVDESLVYSRNKYADSSGIGIEVGISHFVKNINQKIEVIPTGYDSTFWKNHSTRKEKAVVTIAGAGDYQTFRRKGIDFLAQIAKNMPDTKFHVIGIKTDFLISNCISFPKNLINHGYVNYDELPKIISNFKVFAQFSLSEGLPNSLCEAMLCECIPVGSEVNGIPKGIGGNGFVLGVKDVALGTKLIKKALESDETIGRDARKHILQLFPIELRSTKLLDAIDNLFI